MDLVRTILVKLENAPAGGINFRDIKGYSPEIVMYHFEIMDEAGLIESKVKMDGEYLFGQARRLTWKGHDFLAAAKDNGRWEKAKEIISKNGGELVLDLLHDVLISLMTDTVKRAIGT